MRQDARYSSGAKRLRAAAQNVREPLNYVTNANIFILDFMFKAERRNILCEFYTTYRVNAQSWDKIL